MASWSRRPDDQTPVGRFVADMARDLTLSHNAADERTRRQLQRLVEWATNEGVALNRELILDPDTIERFVESPCRGSLPSNVPGSPAPSRPETDPQGFVGTAA